MTERDLQDLRDAVIASGMIGILGPLMAIGWWNATSRKPASPAVVKGIWMFLGGLGGLLMIAMLILVLAHIHAGMEPLQS